MTNGVDVLIRGDGAVGRSLALALGAQGLGVALLGRPAPSGAAPGADVRTYALNAASVALMQQLRVWDALPQDAATAVYDMRVRGDRPGSELEFSAWQQGVRELAFIVDAAALEAQLDEALRYAARVQRVAQAVPAALELVCEGRDSARRAQLLATQGGSWQRHDYGHRAIAARLCAEQGHAGVARQWFRSPDVLALLPFDQPQPGTSFGLVWSLPEAEAERLMALEPLEFEAELNAACADAAPELGALTLHSPRQSWPLALGRAQPLCGSGWALLGDAAHQVHPLAGQGLNLGLGDVRALCEVLSEREPWRALGDIKLLRRYERARAWPTWTMGELTDALLRGFASSHPVSALLRNQGMGLLNQLAPLKRWLTSQALGR
ncbi:FAD-dependent monooxygenase [Roseateles sp. BYS180W]|uniref:FAD-dependent monooxygenase n=1 Tax=Roseateles rivi TaxID=3299028 RepID=A0ABW7FS48_9BURK